MKPLIYITLLFVPLLLLALKNEQSESHVTHWEKHIVANYGTGMITSVTASDYTGDGKIDIISSLNGRVILYTAPNWKPSEIHKMAKAKGKAISSVSFDVDGDGDVDWLGGDAQAGAFWLENPSKKGVVWKMRTVNNNLGGIHSIILADVNCDGKDDVLINNFKNDGTLANSSMWYEVPSKVHDSTPWIPNVFAMGDAKGGSHYFGFGDIDGDGWGEIALGAKGGVFENGNWFAYWKNPGTKEVKNVWTKELLIEDEIGATNILIKDVNGDGRNDFICSNGHGVGVFWLEAPGWKRHDVDIGMECPHSLTAGDYDGDGDVDVASCGFQSMRVSIYYNDERGNFSREDIDVGQQSYDLHSVDMDGDGDLDLINAGRASANVVWYENMQK